MTLDTNVLKKERKRWVLIVILALASLLLLGTLLGVFSSKPQRLKALAAMPDNCALLLETADYPALRKAIFALPYANELLQLSLVAKMTDDLRLIDSLLHHQASTAPVELLAGLVPSNAGDYDFIYTTERQDIPLEKLFVNFKEASFKKSTFKQQTIHEIKLKSGKTLAVCAYGNLLIFGRHSFLVEFAVAQFYEGSSNLLADDFLVNSMQSAGKNKTLSLFVNLSAGRQHWKSFLGQQQLASLRQISFEGKWASIDLQFEAHGIAASGFVEPDEQQPIWAGLSDSKQVETPSISKAIPDTMEELWAYSSRDFQAFYSELSTKPSSIFSEFIAPWVGEEWALFSIKNNKNIAARQAIFQIGDSLLQAELLDNYIHENELKPLSRGQYPIYSFLEKKLALPLFDLDSLAFEEAFFAQYQSYFLVSNSMGALLEWLRKLEVNESLYRKPNYLQFTSKLPATYNMAYYTEQTPTSAETWGQLPSQLAPVGWRMQGYNGRFFVNGFLMVGKKKVQKGKTWELELEAKTAIAPSVIDLPHSKKGIFIQDEKHQLYLLDEKGKLLWKRQLDSRILSDFHRLDVYNNDDIQFLFNTKNKLHLINLDGEDVRGKGYPKQIHPATGPLLVIDPKNKKDYQIYIPCENGRIYGFQEDGQPIAGWRPMENIGSIKAPLQYMMWKSRPHFWGINTTGQLFIWDENGENIRPPAALNSTFGNSFALDTSLDLPRVIAIDDLGTAYIANLDNDFFKVRMQKGKKVNSFVADVTANLEKDYVSLQGRDLLVYKHTKRAWRHRFDESQDFIFPIKRPNSPKHYVGSFSSFSRRIYCFDEAGELLEGFPIQGTQPIVLTHFEGLESPVVVVANAEVVYVRR